MVSVWKNYFIYRILDYFLKMIIYYNIYYISKLPIKTTLR